MFDDIALEGEDDDDEMLWLLARVEALSRQVVALARQNAQLLAWGLMLRHHFYDSPSLN